MDQVHYARLQPRGVDGRKAQTKPEPDELISMVFFLRDGFKFVRFLLAPCEAAGEDREDPRRLVTTMCTCGHGPLVGCGSAHRRDDHKGGPQRAGHRISPRT
jgi:hypothetical protein